MAVRSGTQNAAVTGAALPSLRAGRVWIKNADAGIIVYIGGPSSQDFSIGPGLTAGPFDVENLNEIWIKSASATPAVQYLIG